MQQTNDKKIIAFRLKTYLSVAMYKTTLYRSIH